MLHFNPVIYYFTLFWKTLAPEGRRSPRTFSLISISNQMKYTVYIFMILLTLRVTYSEAQPNRTKYPDPPKASSGTKYPISLTDAQWKEKLTPDQYNILRQRGTEGAFTGKYDHFYEKGTYYSAASLQPVFSSDTKFDSHTGWPSFFAPIDPDAVRLVKDNNKDMMRWEVVDSKSGSHLGHVFDDGPSPTGKRYCLNSAALIFVPEGGQPPVASSLSGEVADGRPAGGEAAGGDTAGGGSAGTQEAIADFAEGCFWHAEIVFQSLVGVRDAVSGYAGGKDKHPDYEKVSAGTTGHAETVQVYYDPAKISFATLVAAFFASQDPTQLNRQGPDIGTQYRSIAFYRNQEEKKIIDDEIKRLTAAGKYAGKIVTQVLPFTAFYPAESYHQEYILHHPDNPYVQQVSLPDFVRFKNSFSGNFK